MTTAVIISVGCLANELIQECWHLPPSSLASFFTFSSLSFLPVLSLRPQMAPHKPNCHSNELGFVPRGRAQTYSKRHGDWAPSYLPTEQHSELATTAATEEALLPTREAKGIGD